jgi:hypothetical protein
MRVHQSNLVIALSRAITVQENQEHLRGYTRDSGFLGGLRDVLSHIEKGGQIEIIVDEPK